MGFAEIARMMSVTVALGNLEAAAPEGVDRLERLRYFAERPEECHAALVRLKVKPLLVAILPGTLWLYLTTEGRAAGETVQSFLPGE